MLSVTMTESGGPADLADALPEMCVGSAVETVQHWHGQMMPEHFTEQGFTKYAYQKRKGQDEPALIPRVGNTARSGLKRNHKYYWDKWWRKHTHDPLVFTGRSREQAKSSIRVNQKIVGPTKRAKDAAALAALNPDAGSGAGDAAGFVRAVGVLNVPSYFWKYLPGSPNKAEELTTTTPDEDRQLTDFYNASMRGKLLGFAGITRTTNVA